jgi:transcriptional regulator with XRE-family HTH domain
MQLLQDAKAQSGLSYSQLAGITGIPRASLVSYMTDNYAYSLDMAIRIGNALNLAPDTVKSAWKAKRISEVRARLEREITDIMAL